MSYTFDTIQGALDWLSTKVVGDAQAQDVIAILSEIADDLHEYCHTDAPDLNRVAGNKPDLLTTALRYKDDEERREWLKRKSC